MPMRLIPPLVLAVATLQGPNRYELDAAGSDVTAKVAFVGMFSKTARFPKMTGAIMLAPENLEAMDLRVTLDATALTAGDAVTLGRLKGPDFFDVANHPTVTFQGHGMTMTGPKSSKVTGTITARGVTKPATLTVSFAEPPQTARKDDAIDLTATTTIDRRDYGMTAYSLVVGKKVTITIKARMVPA